MSRHLSSSSRILRSGLESWASDVTGCNWASLSHLKAGFEHAPSLYCGADGVLALVVSETVGADELVFIPSEVPVRPASA